MNCGQTYHVSICAVCRYRFVFAFAHESDIAAVEGVYLRIALAAIKFIYYFNKLQQITTKGKLLYSPAFHWAATSHLGVTSLVGGAAT